MDSSPLPSAQFITRIPVRDLAKARAFYGGRLSLALVSDAADVLLYQSGNTTVRLELVPNMVRVARERGEWFVPDLAATARNLEARGVPREAPGGVELDALGIWAAPNGGRCLWIRDPDNSLVRIIEG